MPPWVLASLAAALFQTARFALQKRLAGTGAGGGLTPTGATYARFLWSAPLALAGALCWAWASGQALPGPSARFLGFAAVGGLAQVLATVATVRLLTLRRFAVGITLIKTEVLLTALVGLLVLGERLAWEAVGLIAIGVAGLVVLSRPPRLEGPQVSGAVLGLAAGLLFGVSAVSYRGAALALDEGGAVLRALVTLAVVTGLQLGGMTAWLAWRDRGEIGRVARGWRGTAPVGVASVLGSACWFTAFALQSAALVKAVGQVELLASLIVGRLAFGELPSGREAVGIALLAASVLGVVLVA